MKTVKGYKVFQPDWTCRDFQYEVGKTYYHEGSIGLCSSGFHFCERLVDCFNYYPFNPENKVAEIVATDEVIKGDDKSVTNNIEIVRELSWNDVLNLVNTGKGNTGFCNSGDCNSGNCNSGNCNSGDRNSGDWNSGNCNSGDCNSGDRNSGDCNSGNCNSGNCNSGNCNSGDRNSGDWNSGNCNSGNCNSGNWNSGDCNSGDRNSGMFNACNHANGLFNTKSPKISMFNKQTKMTYEEFQEKYPEAYNLLYYSRFRLTQWIYECDMTPEEKETHPEYKVQEGYLKTYTYKEACQSMWEGFSKTERNKIKKLPNFDKNIFKEITGIEV